MGAIENLENLWQNPILTEVEGEEVGINEQKLAEEVKRELSLVGKLTVERTSNKEVIRSKMSKVWKTTKSFTLVDIKPNLFVISFKNPEDK